MRCFVSFALALLLSLTPGAVLAKSAASVDESFNLERNQLIAAIMSQQLSSRHFSRTPLDDALSRKIYDLYLNQLDPRKRFLLQEDVRKLDSFRERIDDELRRGGFRLPDAGRQLLNARIREADRLIDPILDAGFDFNRKEALEIDPKKLEFVSDEAALKERWRLTLKMQVLDSYFEELEDRKKAEQKKAGQGQPRQGATTAAAPEPVPDPAAHPEQMQEAVRKVRSRMHRALQRLQEQSLQDHYDRYFDAVARAFDPHSSYMPPTTKEDFDIQMSGSLEGIGALLREDEGLIKVVRIMPGSPAEKQGQLQAEDTILSVAEKGHEAVDITEMRIREAVKLIRGPRGSQVLLNVRKPDGGKMSIVITRDIVQLDETYARSALLHTDGGTPIGYIRIPGFYRDFSNDKGKGRNATDDTRRLVQQLKRQGIRGLILDLRNNGGGALEDAVDITGLFLPGGPAVQVKDGGGHTEVRSDEDTAVEYDGVLIVLVNQFSASASEILAAALQDYGRAVIIGSQHTHGKGTVQAMLDMNRYLPLFRPRRLGDLGALKMTIQKFYRINGGSTQFRGVKPDLIVPSMLDHLESGEQYMDYPLPWDQVLPVPYQTWKGPMLDRAMVQSRGKEWVAHSAAFQKIKQESDEAKLRAQRTVVTVAWEDMWRERQLQAKVREEAKAAGFVEDPGEEEENEGRRAGREKKLEEGLAHDPYVQLSLELFGNMGKKEASAVRAR